MNHVETKQHPSCQQAGCISCKGCHAQLREEKGWGGDNSRPLQLYAAEAESYYFYFRFTERYGK
ncbi:MAG: hypothetical protein ACXWB9_04305 [Flavisolibacter sp.]